MVRTASGARRLIIAAACAGFALRLAFGFLYWVDKPLTHDEREYLALAASVAAGRGFQYASAPDGTTQQFGRAPGYPLFLAAIGAGTTDATSSPARVKAVQAAVGAVGVWMIGLLAWRAAGPRAGTLAAAIAALYPPLAWMPAYVLSETLYSVAALAVALVLQHAADRASAPSTHRAAAPAALAAGLLAGIAVLTRPAMLLFIPLAAAWLLATRRAVLAVAFLAAAAAVIAPWTARNSRVYGRFVLVASEGGVTFWTGNHPLARGEGDLAANIELKRAELEFRRARPRLTAEELEPLYYRDAFAYIAERPGHWMRLMARKAFYTVVPVGPSYALHSTRYRVASLVSYLLVLSCAVAGARRLWRSPSRPAALFLLAGSAVLVCLVFFPQERFRIPVIDPVLIVSAAAWFGSRIRS